MSLKERRAQRGTDFSMIFQDPTSAMNPVYKIGLQFREVLRRRDPKINQKEADIHATEILNEVSITDASRVLGSYPFQLSGGMNQRIMIAMALVNQPKLLIADEPGTALDVTVQAQTLRLMRELVVDHGTSVLFISHNLGVVRESQIAFMSFTRAELLNTVRLNLCLKIPDMPIQKPCYQPFPVSPVTAYLRLMNSRILISTRWLFIRCAHE